MPYVVGIASIPGGGKTSLTEAVTNALSNAVDIHLDDYESITSRPIDEMTKWMQRGADFNDFKIPQLVENLYKLKCGESIFNPVTQKNEQSKEYIIFETNYGREHKDTAQYIDLLIWIDTPLDIALARTLKKITAMVMNRPQEQNTEHNTWLYNYLDNYINVVRDLVKVQQDRISRNADIKIDGCMDIDSLTAKMLQTITARLV